MLSNRLVTFIGSPPLSTCSPKAWFKANGALISIEPDSAISNGHIPFLISNSDEDVVSVIARVCLSFSGNPLLPPCQDGISNTPGLVFHVVKLPDVSISNQPASEPVVVSIPFNILITSGFTNHPGFNNAAYTFASLLV